MHKFMLSICFTGFLWALETLPARAAMIVDRPNALGNAEISIGALDPITTESFGSALTSVSTAATFQVDFYSGAGYAGPDLNFADAESLMAGGPGSMPVTFYYSSPLAIAAGGIFTLRLVQVTGSSISFTIVSSSSSRSNPDTPAISSAALLNVAPAATPEPSGFVLVSSVLACASLTALRKRVQWEDKKPARAVFR